MEQMFLVKVINYVEDAKQFQIEVNNLIRSGWSIKTVTSSERLGFVVLERQK